MKLNSLNSTWIDTEGHAEEARLYLRWSIARSSIEPKAAGVGSHR